MARWQKVLARMLTDAKPTSYTYDEATAILRGLGFELAPSAGGSHRKWRYARDGRVVYIGLVESGKGTLKAYLVRDMIKALHDANLLPTELLHNDDVDD